MISYITKTLPHKSFSAKQSAGQPITQHFLILQKAKNWISYLSFLIAIIFTENDFGIFLLAFLL